MTLNFWFSCLWDYRSHLHTPFPAVLGLERRTLCRLSKHSTSWATQPKPHCKSPCLRYLPSKAKNHQEKVTRLRNSTSAKELRGGRWCQGEPTAAWTGKELGAVFLLWKPIPAESLGLFKPNAFTAWNEWLHDLSLHARRPCCYTWSLAALGASRK